MAKYCRTMPDVPNLLWQPYGSHIAPTVSCLMDHNWIMVLYFIYWTCVPTASKLLYMWSQINHSLFHNRYVVRAMLQHQQTINFFEITMAKHQFQLQKQWEKLHMIQSFQILSVTRWYDLKCSPTSLVIRLFATIQPRLLLKTISIIL
jgi:hypothetical protein